MALTSSQTAWANLIVTQLKSINSEIVGSEETRLIAVWEKILTGDINHLTGSGGTNAILPGTFANGGGAVAGLGGPFV